MPKSEFIIREVSKVFKMTFFYCELFPAMWNDEKTSLYSKAFPNKKSTLKIIRV